MFNVPDEKFAEFSDYAGKLLVQRFECTATELMENLKRHALQTRLMVYLTEHSFSAETGGPNLCNLIVAAVADEEGKVSTRVWCSLEGELPGVHEVNRLMYESIGYKYTLEKIDPPTEAA